MAVAEAILSCTQGQGGEGHAPSTNTGKCKSKGKGGGRGKGKGSKAGGASVAHRSLRVLNLNNNSIGDAGMAALCEMIARNGPLTTLTVR